MRTYGHPVSIQKLFAVFVALAILFAPFTMRSAMAMAPSDHHAQMMEGGHCGEQPAKGGHDSPSEKSSCVAMCAAVAVAPTASVEPQSFSRLVERPALDQFHHSFLAKLPTPPPRLA